MRPFSGETKGEFLRKLNLSGIDRIIATASNFFSVLLIWQHLPGRADLERGVSLAQVQRIVPVDPL